AVTTVAAIAEHWSVNPPSCLKAGGLAVRELNVVSELIGTDELTAAFWIELASQARLIGREDSQNAFFAPTVYYDTWRLLDPGHQWAPVAAAWLRMDRDVDGMTSGVGERLSVLGEVPSHAWRPELRSAVLQVLNEVPIGEVCEFPELLNALAVRRPRAQVDRLRFMAEATLREADLLGIVARGSITGLGRALTDHRVREEQLAAVASSILPPVAEEFVAQADLTLVVPGPPSPALRQLLNLVADVESTGGAAVFRVTAESAARALAGGLSPADLIAELKTKSATPLPQPLEYLINDAARRHGGVRVGSAISWISSDDEALVASMLTDPRGTELGLTRIAPSVIVSTASGDELLAFAASLGHIPTLVGEGGESIAVTRPAHRAPDPMLPVEAGIDEVFVAALATALRRSELDEPPGISIAAPHELPRMPTAATAQVLRRAQTTQMPVWVGYADNAGSMSRRLVDVVAADGGAISAFDHSHGRIRTLVLSRITGAVLADDVNLPPIDENYDTAKERQ
ncbi:MAG: helicase-associated domain-containing protein, partial [Candidatus Nanopelagicales bacterium]